MGRITIKDNIPLIHILDKRVTGQNPVIRLERFFYAKNSGINMASNKFYKDSTYKGEDWSIEIQESVDGVLQSFTGATLSGGIRLGNVPAFADLTFTSIDEFTVEASLSETDTATLQTEDYKLGIRVNYADGTDVVLINGILTVKDTFF
ncbi:MAG: hypothetical protein COA84_14290 [Robiginitomaculum sp.]|nr:MAG: hypothetical protein COA84_14290 [Robiginitomaculum sp.]